MFGIAIFEDGHCVLAFFTSLGILFQSSTVLFEKKFLLTSNLAAWGLKLSGSAALLVSRSGPSTFGTRPRFNVIASFVEIRGFCYEFHAFSSAAVCWLVWLASQCVTKTDFSVESGIQIHTPSHHSLSMN